MLTSKDVIHVQFTPITVKAFNGELGYWSNYKNLRADNVTSVQVIPMVNLYDIHGTDYLKVDCHFNPEEFPEDRYGIIYGDEQFEEEIQRHINEVLAVDNLNITYTEQGMQQLGIVSMEGDQAAISFFRSISNHTLLKWIQNPQIAQVTINGSAKFHNEAQ